MTTYLGNIHKNIMGTTSFTMRIAGMRRNQEFIAYPVGKEEDAKEITIQSDTRIGTINLETGIGQMCAPRSSGASFVDLALGRKRKFALRDVDLAALKMFIFSTASKKAGNNGIVYCDNSQASNVL